ncbi:MAG: hypothetical protein ACE5EA_00605 [Nitrospirota bacterium]
MKRLLIVIAIAAITIGVGFSMSAWAAHNGDLETNTISSDSDRLGLDPTNHISTFTQDGSGTVGDNDPLTNDYFPVGNPGAFTNNPFGCVSPNTPAFGADFGFGTGCDVNKDGIIDINDPNEKVGADNPMTAPNFDGPNTAVGTIIVKVPVSLSSSGASGDLTFSGTIDFCLQMTVNTKICANNPDPNADPNNPAQQGLAVVLQTFDQTLSLIDNSDPNNPVSVGTQRAIVDNTNAGAPITFMTEPSDQTLGNASVRNIPWSINITQDIPFPGDNFQLVVSGIFPYEIEPGDANPYRFDGAPCKTIRPNLGVGLTGSCYPDPNIFDLPGFGSGQNNFPDYLPF